MGKKKNNLIIMSAPKKIIIIMTMKWLTKLRERERVNENQGSFVGRNLKMKKNDWQLWG